MEILLERLAGALIIVVALMAGAFHLYSRLEKARRGKGQELIRIAGTTHIDPRKALVLVEVGGERILIGLTRDSITYLTKLKGPEGVKGDVS